MPGAPRAGAADVEGSLPLPSVGATGWILGSMGLTLEGVVKVVAEKDDVDVCTLLLDTLVLKDNPPSSGAEFLRPWITKLCERDFAVVEYAAATARLEFVERAAECSGVGGTQLPEPLKPRPAELSTLDDPPLSSGVEFLLSQVALASVVAVSEQFRSTLTDLEKDIKPPCSLLPPFASSSGITAFDEKVSHGLLSDRWRLSTR